jgi:hypothetical protein
MKTPKSSAAKTSLPGKLFVGRVSPGEPPVVFPHGDIACKGLESAMWVVYNKRPVPGVFEDFAAVRARVNREWASVVLSLSLFGFLFLSSSLPGLLSPSLSLLSLFLPLSLSFFGSLSFSVFVSPASL